MTFDPLDHGPRLTDEEYDRRVVGLQAGLPPSPSREQREQVRRAELELAVAHRLGKDFPRERLEALWAVLERVERRRGRLIAWHLLRHLWPGALEAKAQGVAGFLVAEFAKVLSPAELERYFGSDEVRAPTLPIDRGDRP